MRFVAPFRGFAFRRVYIVTLISYTLIYFRLIYYTLLCGLISRISPQTPFAWVFSGRKSSVTVFFGSETAFWGNCKPDTTILPEVAHWCFSARFSVDLHLFFMLRIFFVEKTAFSDRKLPDYYLAPYFKA